jgi:hypothetical protein
MVTIFVNIFGQIQIYIANQDRSPFFAERCFFCTTLGEAESLSRFDKGIITGDSHTSSSIIR